MAHPVRRAFAPGVMVVLLTVAGCGGPGAPDAAEARAVVTRFVEQIRAGDIDAAWESTTADFKSDEGRESFRRFARSRPALQGALTIVELKPIEVHGLTRWEAVLHPTGNLSDPKALVRTMIAAEADVWKVDRIVVE